MKKTVPLVVNLCECKYKAAYKYFDVHNGFYKNLAVF